MQKLRPYFSIISYCTLFVGLSTFELNLCYGHGKHHSLVPLIIFGGSIIFVVILGGLAAYQTFKHRNSNDTE